SGSQFILTYTGNTNRGQMTVYVDNVNQGTINQFNSSLAWQSTWTSSTFSNGPHTVRLVHASGSVVDIDAIEILGPLPAGTYDDTLGVWDYSNNWTAYAGSGPYNNTLHYSTILNEAASLEFSGTQFVLTYTGNTNRGQVAVYVDSNYVGFIDQYSPGLAWQKTWTSPTFSNSVHTLQLVHATGASVDIDAIRILP
ncbi:MAG: hypothetical protein AB8I58_09990, partial [Anaerolineales bacterium]